MESKQIVSILAKAACMALKADDMEQFMSVCDLIVYLEGKHLIHREDAEKI